MNEGKKRMDRRKVAWGITGSGEKLPETVNVMKVVKQEFEDRVDLRVYASKAGDQVLKYYKLTQYVEGNFGRVWVEINSNSPFLAGQLQSGKFEFLVIAPTTSNTVAKIAVGLGDSMLSNSAIMSLKASVPVYLMPSDQLEGTLSTILPSGKSLLLKIRKEDADNVRKLAAMESMHILEKPEDILHVFRRHFG
ncbi:MAG: archaeoflavoprotein AfpA [Promethearchaeati archaeon SRVP18_Atabeyarchaeia-1]